MENYTTGEAQLRKQLASITVLDHGVKAPLTPGFVEGHMYVAVVNTSENAEVITRCPHESIANLSAVVKCDLGDDRYLLVTNDFVQLFKKSPEEIFEEAKFHSANEGYICKDLNQVLRESLGMDSSICDYIPEMQSPVYVITTPRGIDGASVIASRSFMREVHNKFGEDFYVLPSSRHEVLAIPFSKAPAEVDELREMVFSVNASEVDPRDRLSNDVYYFDGRCLQLADALTAERDNVFTAAAPEPAVEHHRSR